MANDALALSGIDVGLPQEAEYDAVYAAVTATERGHWFLTEFASRNRHADTSAQQAAHSSDIGGAADRLADIAMELRERGADTMLCDALDAAVREISGVGASGAENHDVKDDATIPDQSAAIGVDTAAPESGPPPPDASGAIVTESASHSDPFDLPLQDNEKFAEAAAALAASLNALGEEAKPVDESQATHSAAVVPEPDYEMGAAPSPQSTASIIRVPRWHIEAPDFVFHQQQRAVDERAVDSANGSSQPHALLPGLQLLPSPDEDPAELFEPASKRVVAPPPAMPSTSAANNPPARSPTCPTVRPLPRPAPVNPLAALRALTEEELIALFG